MTTLGIVGTPDLVFLCDLKLDSYGYNDSHHSKCNFTSKKIIIIVLLLLYCIGEVKIIIVELLKLKEWILMLQKDILFNNN